MKFAVFLSFLIVATFAQKCYVPNPNATEFIVKPLDQIPKSELPSSFTWQDINGFNMLTLTRSQNTPQYCGACWAFAATSALSDRIKIARNGSWPEINLSPQNLLTCDLSNKGCDGGDPLSAYEHIFHTMTVDETCANYQALGWTNGLNCSKFATCGTCAAHNKCHLPKSYYVYGVTEYGKVQGETAMMNEIYQRGPIVCNLASAALKDYTSGILDGDSTNNLDHSVEVVGWGIENGKKYWVARNSWGSFWGQDGFFNITKGKNTFGIESACAWAVPQDTWTNGLRNYSKNHKTTVNSEKVIENQFELNPKKFLPDNLINEDIIVENAFYPDQSLDRTFDLSQTPFKHIKESDIPVYWDWRNVDGVNYITWTKNQHLPKYCGACWAESVTSVLADRIMVARKGKGLTLGLSPQSLINCHMGGSCGGGDPLSAFKNISVYGIAEESCQAYVAHKVGKGKQCRDWQICEICLPGTENQNGTCIGVTNYKKWNISSFGVVREILNMKRAILHGGPIVCGVYVTNEFNKYQGGVFSEFTLFSHANHFISVVGWGETKDGQAYWIGRNSWGSYWGEMGFFRIQMGNENLGIENECFYAYPVIE